MRFDSATRPHPTTATYTPAAGRNGSGYRLANRQVAGSSPARSTSCSGSSVAEQFRAVPPRPQQHSTPVHHDRESTRLRAGARTVIRRERPASAGRSAVRSRPEPRSVAQSNSVLRPHDRSASTHTHHNERRCAMSYLKRHGTRRVPQWLPLPGQAPNSAGGYAWAVDVWTRLRRFLILGSEGGSYYASEWTLTRENAQAVEAVRPRGRPARGRRDRARLDRGPGAEERPGALRARAGGGPRRRGDAPGGARRRCRRWRARARTCSSSRCSSRASAAGAARSAARSAAGTRRSRSTRSPTRRSSTASGRA